MDKKLLIQKFLANQASKEEAAAALRYLEQDSSLLEELMPQSDWENIDPNLEVPEQHSAEMRNTIMRATKPRSVLRYLTPIAVAAAVAAIFLSIFITTEAPTTIETASKLVAVESSPSRKYDTLLNAGPAQQTLTLKDGSSIKLYAHSTLIVPADMSVSRHIKLTGKAVFNVVKNPSLPFVVATGAISTTALGTVFMVDATVPATNIHIALYEGKVVIKPIQAQLTIEDTYLKPGQQCDVDMVNKSVAVADIPALVKHAVSSVPVPAAISSTNDLSLHFEKVPLAETFKRLEHRFGTTILVDSSILSAKLFTGRFEEDDSLTQILHILGTMNGLTVAQHNDAFVLHKKTGANQEITLPKIAEMVAFTDPDIAAPVASPAAQKSISEKEFKADDLTGTITRIGEFERYRKVPLAVVFDSLTQRNDIRIEYKEADIEGLFFTGIIPDDHTYFNTLQVICKMNNLKLHKTKRGIYTVGRIRKNAR